MTPAPSNVLVYLVGFAGVGKLTVARALAPLIGARVVDNHWINNPIFGLLDNDRTTPFPEAVWAEIDKVREAVLATIATIAAPEASFVLTHAGCEDDPEDRAIYDQIRSVAERRGSLFLPIRLVCSEAELCARVVSPDRAARLKGMDPSAARRDVGTREVLKTRHPSELTIDTTTLDPSAAAGLIRHHIESMPPRPADSAT